MILAEIVLWLAAAWIAYALVLYPGLTVVVGGLLGRLRKPVCGGITPRISFIISAYNEEKAIEEKVRQTLALDYPPDRLEVIVASDGSTDRTDEIVREIGDPRVRLFRAEGRLGKTATVTGAVAVATGELLVFSDATGVFSQNALRALASRFVDPTVGCVAGRVAYRYGSDSTSEGFKGYQRVAVAVRRAENGFGNQTSVSGSIHAMRRDVFRPGRPGFSMDVIDAVHTVVQGKRVVYEYDAVSMEDSRNSNRDEFNARVRISVRNNSMARYIVSALVGSRRWFYLFQMVSHKMMRWWLWLPLSALFLSSLVLATQSVAFGALAVAQLGLYGLAVVGLVWSLTEAPLGGVVALASFFLVGNAAMCVGTVKGLMGAQKPAWEPQR